MYSDAFGPVVTTEQILEDPPSRRDLSPLQRVYAHSGDNPTTSQVEAIEASRATVLIGVSTTGGAFDRRVVGAMAERNARPIIFAIGLATYAARRKLITDQCFIVAAEASAARISSISRRPRLKQ